MAHPLESAIAVAIKNERDIQLKLNNLDQELRAALDRENILKGHVERLNKELDEAKGRTDHYLRWLTEVTKQMHNIGLFVQDAMRLAKIEVDKAKQDGRVFEVAHAAIEQALEVDHEPVQRKEQR